MLCHWDDVPWSAFEHADLKMQRQRLGAAAGVRDIGLSRYLIAPGCRGMPLHVHADEEEIVFVLAGSGLSWQDDAVHEVRAGDAIVHRRQEEAHTLGAAPDETLEVLIFGSGSPTGLTQVPRAEITRVGARWLPPDAPHPLQAEPPAGEPPAPSPRPPTIVALEDVEGAGRGHGRVARVRRDLGRTAGSLRSGLTHITIQAGAYGSPRHCHSVEEELFVVLGGDGVVLLGDDSHEVRPGSVVARPPATGVAHAFVAGDDGLTLLAYGTREPADLCWYPDSSKVLFRGIGVVGRIERLGYWDGRALSDLLARRLLVVTGKGGVGKTTVAAALGLLAARAGKRTIVAEVARRGDVASAFDRAGAEPFEEIELADGLFHISIDPQDALEEYLRDQLPRGPVADILVRSRVFGLLAAATPGMRELLTVGKLWELAQLERRTPGADAYDLVVVDAPATGHGVAVLTAPRTFAAAAGTGPVARQGRKIDATLSDPSLTAVVAVARAEELAVTETGELRASLRASMGLELSRVIANALDPDRFDDAEAQELEAHAGRPAVAHALGGHRRALRQRVQLARLAELGGQQPARLALHPGGPELERLADELAPQLDVAS